MARKKRKKPPHDGIDPKGKMHPAEGGAAPKDDEGTRVDDGARHAFFSFKGELKSGLPDATETDLAGNLGLPPHDHTGAADETGATRGGAGATEHEDDATGVADASDATGTTADSSAAATDDSAHATPADAKDDPFAAAPKAATSRDPSASPPCSEDADATPADAADTAATHTELSPRASREKEQHEQSRAGPVRGPDPAAEQKSASQSRKAAGPAHFIPPHEAPPGVSHAPEAAAPSAEAAQAEATRAGRPQSVPNAPAEPATHTDVRGEPFAPARADATHTRIDALLPATPPDTADDAATETEVKPPRDIAPPTPPPVPTPPAPPRPGKVASLGDEPDVGSETMLDAAVTARRAVKEETAAGSETILDALAGIPGDATRGEEIGSATILDVEGVRGPAAGAARQDAVAPTGRGQRALPPFAGPDAETVTREPREGGAGGIEEVPLPDLSDLGAGAPAASPPGADAHSAETASVADAEVSFHDAETASQDLVDVAREAALPPQGAFDLPVPETQAITAARPDVPTAEAPAGTPPMPFAGALFEAPEPTTSGEPAPDRAERPRLASRRRGAKKPQEPLLRRLARWAKRRLDPRDFLEIVGKAAFERARKLGEKLRTERRENRVSHTAGWWRKTLVELGILYAIVIPIELAVTGGRLGSFGVHPHPYWLIVLPLAAARGLVAGLLAAGIASILYAIGAAQAVTDAVFTFRNMTEPLLFFAVAFFAGELHDESLLKRRKGERRIRDLEERTEQLRQQRDVLTDANRELEKRIVDDSVQFGNLIQAARRIERAGRQEVFDLALEMAEEHCGAAASVLMLLDDGSLDYLCYRGFPSDETGKRLAIARRSTFVQRAVSDGVAVNGLDPSEVPPQEGPLVVAPLFDAGGVVKALMCLDEIPLARLNESTVTVFLGIADWASAALARLTRGADAPTPRAAALSVGPEVDIWLGTVVELGKRLRVELARSSRYGVPTSFLTVQATDWKDATREGIDAIDRYVLMHFTTGLRPSDGIYRFGYPGAYLLVLAGTSLKGAEVVCSRLERRVAYAPGPFGAIEIRATGPDTEAPDLMSLIARCARNFRDRSRLPLEARTPVTVPERLEAEDLNAFLRRLKMETSLAVRNGLDLHVVGISAEASEQAGPGILARHVVEVGEQTLRPTDGVYMIGQYQCAVILPCTSGEEAATVAHRLATLVRARDPSAPYGQIETQVLGLGPSHPDAGSFLTALARRGKETSR
jgi:hypothetical protein